jgi:hypothetical protein
MALMDLSDKLAVEPALDKFDRLGRSDFLQLYGFGKAQSYFVLSHGEQYDSKAIAGAGAGHKYQPTELGASRESEHEAQQLKADPGRASGFQMTG